MPMVRGRKFPYTKAGMKAAKKARMGNKKKKMKKGGYDK
jgi:hypothetical protein